MGDKVLIINGVVSTDELSELGLDVAKEFSDSDKVFIIDLKGFARQIKYKRNEDISKVKFIDAKVLRKRARNPV